MKRIVGLIAGLAVLTLTVSTSAQEPISKEKELISRDSIAQAAFSQEALLPEALLAIREFMPPTAALPFDFDMDEEEMPAEINTDWADLLQFMGQAQNSEEQVDIGPVNVINDALDEKAAKDIADVTKLVMAKMNCPGVAIGVVYEDRLVYQGYFGWADGFNDKPVAPETVFRAGSVSKTFTAVGLMQQYEQGKFDLGDNVNNYTPKSVIVQKNKSCSAVDFTDFLTHVSGAGEYKSYGHIYSNDTNVVTKPGQAYPPLSKIYEKPIRTRICPEVKWAYCNFCYGGLGYLLEQLSGESFKDYTQSNVLDRIGMTSSSFYENDEILSRIAQGYLFNPRDKKYYSLPLYGLPVTPMGNLYSTVPDMGQYLIALLNQGKNQKGRLLENRTLETMWQTQYGLDERHETMGLGFFKEGSYLGTRVIGHDGDVPGFSTTLYAAPEKKFGLIVFGNVKGSPPHIIGQYILMRLLGVNSPQTYYDADHARWKGLIGAYGSVAPDYLSDFRFRTSTGGAYFIIENDNKLYLTAPAWDYGLELVQSTQNDPDFYLIAPLGPIPKFITFTPGDGDQAGGMVFGLEQFKRMTPAEIYNLSWKNANVYRWIDMAAMSKNRRSSGRN